VEENVYNIEAAVTRPW